MLEKNRRGIRWDVIPKTFQDVIEILKRLNFHYLWIDNICIFQDDVAD
jgi:hypothetical protein